MLNITDCVRYNILHDLSPIYSGVLFIASVLQRRSQLTTKGKTPLTIKGKTVEIEDARHSLWTSSCTTKNVFFVNLTGQALQIV